MEKLTFVKMTGVICLDTVLESRGQKYSNTKELVLRASSGGFPGGSDGKESACSAGEPGSILGSGRSPGEGNDNPLQYSCLKNSTDRGAWRATIHGVAKSRTRLSD